jgi:glycogen debranching enzyme
MRMTSRGDRAHRTGLSLVAGRSLSSAPPLVTISEGSTFLVCAADSSIESLADQGQGLYADDTRYVSQHRLRLNGRVLGVAASARLSPRHARWTLMAMSPGSVDGDTPGVRVTVTLDRIISAQRLHEDITVQAYGGQPPPLLLEMVVSSDFADIFEVRTQRWQRRGELATTWEGQRLENRYQREDFARRCLIRSGAEHVAARANGELHFPIDLAPGGSWSVCLQYDLLTSMRARPALLPCPTGSGAERAAERRDLRWQRSVSELVSADARLLPAYRQAVEDFDALRLYDSDSAADTWVPAAGIPWFAAVFGRDSLIASLQALPVQPGFAVATLRKLADLQATADDAVRDSEPGKICHEMRVGEWAHFHTIPHTPYFGTADATPLYLMLLAETHRWLGDASGLHRFRGTAERCLDWIDNHGDRDGDGFQEYAPRAPTGYRNHCWRDAEDGVLDERGGFPVHPIATCELQAYVYEAKRSVADLFEAWGDGGRAAALRSEAEQLRLRFIDAFWLESEGTVAFALDGLKRPLLTATSNPGHVLWLGMLDGDRGRRAADRLMRSDIESGWGLRTLSSEHPSYDPHSYQRGSVWPHDTLIGAAGMRRYGRADDSWRLIDGLLSAVSCFDGLQMPELFSGLTRRHPDVPVPFDGANVPQAWAAGSVFHAVRTLLGVEPDVPSGRIYVDPMLPPWCPALTLDNVRIGADRFRISASRRRDGTHEVTVDSSGSALTVVRGAPPRLALPSA